MEPAQQLASLSLGGHMSLNVQTFRGRPYCSGGCCGGAQTGAQQTRSPKLWCSDRPARGNVTQIVAPSSAPAGSIAKYG